MARKKLKLAWVENNNSRIISLRKRRVGIMKKMKEITVLCDVKACMIIYSPNEAGPMIWPSFEAARVLLDRFFALPEVLQKKKEMDLESYLKEKTKKVHEQLMKNHEKSMEYGNDQLMVKLHCGRRIVDLKQSEIYKLLFFSRDMVIRHRTMLGFVTYPPLRDPPMLPMEAQFQTSRTTINDGYVKSGQDDERAGKTDEAATTISIGTLMDNKIHYLIDQWVFPPKAPISSMYQQVGMNMGSSNNENIGSYHGSGSNGNPNVDPQLMTFHGFVGSMSQPLQHYHNPTNINNGHFPDNSNTIATNDSVRARHEPPPNGTTGSQDQVEPAEISSVHPTRRLY